MPCHFMKKMATYAFDDNQLRSLAIVSCGIIGRRVFEMMKFGKEKSLICLIQSNMSDILQLLLEVIYVRKALWLNVQPPSFSIRTR